MDKLNKQQKLFGKQYVIKKFNGTKAAIAAGYSEKSAKVMASQLLTKPNVQEYIQKFIEKQNNKLDITAERVLEEVARLAFIDTSAVYDKDDNLIPIHELPENISRAIASFETTHDKNGTPIKKYKFYKKEKALELLMRNLELLTDKHKLSGEFVFSEKLQKAANRSKQPTDISNSVDTTVKIGIDSEEETAIKLEDDEGDVIAL